MIEAEGLTKYYGDKPAISDVSFHVSEGEIVAFLGPNGAGKTTTMRILTGYMPATTGTARIAGFDIYDQSLDARAHIGYLPEQASFYDDMTVRQYLRFCGRLRGVRRREIDDRVDEVMDACRVTEYADRLISQLSKGYRQRLGLAQALVHNPDVLILDEPTIGLDPAQVVETRELIKNLAKEHTVMLSTHILPEAQMVAERVLIINNGRIIAEDTPEALTKLIRQSSTLLVKVADPSRSVERELTELSEVRGVRRVGVDDEGATYHVDTDVGVDLRPTLAELALKKDWGLLELRQVEMSLEEIFLELTGRQAAAS